ncbi:MAG: ABC transporter ATP-binding protein/permease [Treponema sp.]|jgi:ATP-binding cassette subfamily B protein|nr:ABC transporter ATP-binding protein/permease [Treponema sp.]
MADYFETDTVTKEYDGKLVRRILSYLQPYRALVVLTLAALIVSTLGELYIPVLQQRIIDGSVLARFMAFNSDVMRRQDLSAEARLVCDEFAAMPAVVILGGMIFVPQNQRTVIPGKVERELRDKGILDTGYWYAFSCKPDESAAAALIHKYGALFLQAEDGETGIKAAIKMTDLYSLPPGEIAVIRSGDISSVMRGGIIFLAALVLVFVFTFSQIWTANLISQRVMKDMRLGLFKKTLSQSTAFLSRHPVGRIVTRLTGDVATIDEFFTTVLTAFLKDLSVMLGVLVTLFILSPQLALCVVLTLPPVLILTIISRVKARDAFRRQRTASSKVYAYLAERLAGIQVVQLFRREAKSAREFSERNRELLDANLGEMYVFATFRPIVEWFSTFTAAVLIVVGSKMILSLSVSLGVLIAFVNLVQMFYAPVTDIAEKYTLLQSAMAGGEKVFKLMDTDEHIPDAAHQVTAPHAGLIRGHVVFDNVRFAYKKGEDVLRGLNFAVQPGEMAAIVGYTGAGKTTIINVLSRLWDVDSGEIRMDGVPVKNIPLDELRRAVLPVLQDVFLFSGTVADNISLGLELSQEQIIEAAQAVHAHEFISRLPEGYQTMLSEGATNISSGQRQLISFARVIAHNPQVVILDEATSSIDTETEYLIQMGIKRVLSDRTSFVIAHRLSTIKNADRILVLSGGTLAESGTHEELIAHNGLYAGLYRLQYAENGAAGSV